MAIGGHEGTVARRVVLPVALPGIVTGALARDVPSARRDRPTAVHGDRQPGYSTSLTKPIAALPLVVYIDGFQPYPDLQKIAWGIALFLVTQPWFSTSRAGLLRSLRGDQMTDGSTGGTVDDIVDPVDTCAWLSRADR